VQDRDRGKPRQHLLEQLEALADEILLQGGHAGDIPARPRQTLHQSRSHRIAVVRDHDDRDGRRCLLGGSCRGRRRGHDDIDFAPDQFLCYYREAFCLIARGELLDPEVPAFGVAEGLQRLTHDPDGRIIPLEGRCPHDPHDSDLARVLGRFDPSNSAEHNRKRETDDTAAYAFTVSARDKARAAFAGRPGRAWPPFSAIG